MNYIQICNELGLKLNEPFMIETEVGKQTYKFGNNCLLVGYPNKKKAYYKSKEWRDFVKKYSTKGGNEKEVKYSTIKPLKKKKANGQKTIHIYVGLKDYEKLIERYGNERKVKGNLNKVINDFINNKLVYVEEKKEELA